MEAKREEAKSIPLAVEQEDAYRRGAEVEGLDLEESVRLANARLAMLARSVVRLEGSLDQVRLALGSRNGSRLSDLEAAVSRLEAEVRLLRDAAGKKGEASP